MGKDDEEAAACKDALGRRVSHAGSYGEPEHDGRNVDVLMYTHSEDDEHKDTSQWEAFPRSIHHIASIIPLPSSTTSHISPSFISTKMRMSSIVSSFRRFNKILGGRVGYLNRLLFLMAMSSRFFVNATPGAALTPRVPESHPNHLSGSEQRVYSARSRQHPLPQVLEIEMVHRRRISRVRTRMWGWRWTVMDS